MMKESQEKIVYCRCAFAKVVPQDIKDSVLKSLTESGEDFEMVSDLCELSARKDPSLQKIASCGKVRIAACYPRAVKWLFHNTGHDLSEDAEVINMRELDAEQVLQKLNMKGMCHEKVE
ncbi:MAG: hypothetical protein AAF984_05665 [Verrucomicrobiota bacterium]